VIAADGGYSSLISRGFTPDAVCGDFDSLGYIPDHPNLTVSASEKDETDMMIAVAAGLNRGFLSFVINGALGGRLDHTLGNIQTLAHIAGRGGRGFIAGDGISLTAVRNGQIVFKAAARGYVSVFAFGGPARGVTLDGMKYPLTDAVLHPDFPLGISNEFLGVPARASVRDGTLVAVWFGELYDTAVLDEAI
jgi:thiamine pyrophosphokinase